MPTAKEQLLSMMSPQAARLLDQQMRSQQVAQRSQGAGMLSGLVQAYTGMSDAFQGITSGMPMGAMEQQAIKRQEQLKQQKEKQANELNMVKQMAKDGVTNSSLPESQKTAILSNIDKDPTGKYVTAVLNKYGMPDLPTAGDKTDYTKYLTTLVNNKTVTGKSATKALLSGDLKDLEYIDPEANEEGRPEINLISDFVDVDLDNYTDESVQNANALLLNASKDNFKESVTKARQSLIKKNPEDETDYVALQDQIRANDVEFERLDRLAFEVETNVKSGGKLAEFTEQFKTLAGSQDLESALRKSFIKEKNTEMLAYLPPGIASDKDVALVLQGLPDDFVNPEQAASYLRGLAKLKREEANYERFKMEYLKENNGDAKGLSQALNEKALNEYNTSYRAIVAANPSYERIYNRAKELVQSGMDSLDVRNQLRAKIVQFERGGDAMRNSQIIIQKLKLEGVLQ
jgi:hypothetical protein